MAESVYGIEPHAQGVGRILIRHYVMAVNDRELACKIEIDSGLQSIETAAFTDKFATGVELFKLCSHKRNRWTSP